MMTYLCDYCGREVDEDEWQRCATCDQEMCDTCLETHECTPESED